MKSNILRASVLVFVLSLIAKVIGFIKTIIQASFFGANIYTDAFNVANGFVSNILYMLAAAVAVAFVPLYIQKKNEQKDEYRFATRVVTSLFFLGIVITVFLVIASPIIVKIIAPGYSNDERVLTTKYFCVLSLGFIFSLVVSLYTNILNAERKYGYSAVGSIVNSIVLIISIILFADRIGVWVLVISVPVSYFLQWILLYVKGRRFAKISLKYGLKDEGIKILVLQAIPVLISQTTVEINQVVDRSLLSIVGEGVVTAISYSAVLYSFINTLISAPLSTVIFTELSEAGAANDEKRISSLLNTSYKILILIGIPIVALMFFCSNDIISIIYGHGRFSDQAITECARGMEMYSLCVIPGCIKLVLGRAYYAINDTKRPMIIGIFEVGLNIVLSFLLVKPYGVYGVVGATAISTVIFVIVMIIDFNKKHFMVISINGLFEYWKILITSIVLISSLLLMRYRLFDSALLDLIVKAGVSIVIYGSLLILLREKDIMRMKEKLITRDK